MTPFRQQHRQQRLCFVKTSVHDRIQSISKFTDTLLNSSGTRYWFKLFKHYPNNLSLVFLRATHTFLSPGIEKKSARSIAIIISIYRLFSFFCRLTCKYLWCFYACKSFKKDYIPSGRQDFLGGTKQLHLVSLKNTANHSNNSSRTWSQT